MTFQNDKFIFSDPKFLLYFLPRKLNKESTFPTAALSFKQKNVELEVSGFNIMDLQQSNNFLSCLENRFCIYERTPFFENQEFSLCFQSLDLSTKTYLFTKNKKKIRSQVGLLPFLKEKDSFFKNSKGNFLVKGRILRLSKGGFVSSCFGNPALIIRSALFYKLQKQKSYKAWFSLNLSYYGILSYFNIVNFKRIDLPCSKKHQRKSLSKRLKFYYFKNEMVRYFFLLGKPKNVRFMLS
jgi:hypothetical protein